MTTLVAEHVRYVPTPEDVLWLRRAVEAEGPPSYRVAATLVNGFMWARARLNSGRTLASWVRAYAQPVNPQWFVSGAKYKAALAEAQSDEERNALQNRAYLREHVHSTRTEFSDETLRAVEQALHVAPELKEATDYAAPSKAKGERWKALTIATPGQNRFWVRPAAIGWGGYTVSGVMVVDGRGSAALLAVIAIWLLFRRRT